MVLVLLVLFYQVTLAVVSHLDLRSKRTHLNVRSGLFLSLMRSIHVLAVYIVRRNQNGLPLASCDVSSLYSATVIELIGSQAHLIKKQPINPPKTYN